MSQDRIRLLEHIAYDHFGSAVGEVASLLLKRGALPFSHLLRLSSLPPATLHQSLLILSLHSCLFHSESEINGKHIESYEINDAGIERRLRGSIYLHMAVDVLDQSAGEAVEMLWSQGMCKPQEIAEHLSKNLKMIDFDFEPELEESSNGKRNGKGKGKADTESEDALEKGMQTVRFLHENGYISLVTPGSQLSPLSLEIKWEEEIRNSIKGIPTGKQQKEIKEDLKRMQLEYQVEERLKAKGITPGGNAAEAPKRKTKKKKKLSMYDDDEEPTTAKVDYKFQEDAWYKLNSERFHIRWRSTLIEKYAEDRYNKQASIVMQVILKIVEGDVDSMDDPESKAVSINEITRTLSALETSPELQAGLGKKSLDKNFKTSLTVGQLAQEYLRILSCDDDFSMDRATAFLKQFGAGDGAGAKYSVPYDLVGAKMKRGLVEAMIEEITGTEGVRCWRILEEKGKLDEKHLAKLAFLSVKQCREIIGKLSSNNLIEPQEVPRSAERAPSRTFYLWFVDYAKAVNALLGHLYKALANLQAQKQYQLSLRKGLIAKRDRTDVRADPSLLTESEKAAVERLERVMEHLTVAEMRIDEDVFVLCDLDPF